MIDPPLSVVPCARTRGAYEQISYKFNPRCAFKNLIQIQISYFTGAVMVMPIIRTLFNQLVTPR